MKRFIIILLTCLSVFSIKSQNIYNRESIKIVSSYNIPKEFPIYKDSKGYFIKLDKLRLSVSETAYRDLKDTSKKDFHLFVIKLADENGYYYYITYEDREKMGLGGRVYGDKKPHLEDINVKLYLMLELSKAL